MSEPLVFVPLDIASMTDEEIGTALRKLGEQFPYSGHNYDMQFLEEALKRLREFERKANL
jgi:hypothetical protein